jgi:hypothetical protein
MDYWNRRGAGPAATQAVYDGEVTLQAGYNTTLLAQQRDLKLMMSL